MDGIIIRIRDAGCFYNNLLSLNTGRYNEKCRHLSADPNYEILPTLSRKNPEFQQAEASPHYIRLRESSEKHYYRFNH